MAHVLLIAIGPVQDFIASARRCRDLWFGSWLLSELAKAAAVALIDTAGGDPAVLVFPSAPRAALAPGSALSVANKLVARVPDGLDPAVLATAAVAAVRERLRLLADEAFDKVDDRPTGDRPTREALFHRAVAADQVRDLIDVAWVSAPEQGADGYADARRLAERLLSARKATRLWQRHTWGAFVPKSSLDGARESVLDERLFDASRDEDDLRRRYGVGPSERLCGVGMLKRHGVRCEEGEEHRFISTPHLAAGPLLARLAQMAAGPEAERVRAAWTRYVEALRAEGANLGEIETVHRAHPVARKLDGQIFFEGRLAERFSDTPLADRAAHAQRARHALGAFFRAIDVPAPQPYFAVLVADGDHMGDLINAQKKPADHVRLSQALASFAAGARTIVEDHHEGALVYAGGDDVLAFVPVHRAVACARKLRDDFVEQLREFATEARTPSLSIGLGISHFLTPMGQALRTARGAEASAKVLRGALAVVVDKRSGPPVEVVGPWGDIDVRLQYLTALHRADEVPDGVAFELLELGRLLRGADDDASAALKSVASAEARRILGRKRSHRGEHAVQPDTIERLLASPDALAECLITARLLATAEDHAGRPQREKEGP